MATNLTRRQALQLGAGGLALAGLGHAGRAAAQAALPGTMIWSTYDVGSSGYVESSAIADAFGKKYGTRIRLQPSGTAIGRVKPLLDKRVDYGWLANEVFFAAEGIYEYCTPELGPQDLRTLAGRINSLSVVVAGTSGIRTVQDLKGRRFAIARANSSANVKMEAILAFAGMSWDDLDLVEMPGYGATMKALIEGRAEATAAAPASPALRELEASPYGIGWVGLPAQDVDGWARARRVLPFVEPYEESLGPGLSKEKAVWMIGYRHPMLTTRADSSADQAYIMLKSIAETYELYKDATPIMGRWQISRAGTPPMDAAMHEGAVRYLREIGQWSAANQTWQEAMLHRHAAMQEAWRRFITTPEARGVEGERLRTLWGEARAKVIDSL